MKKFLLLFAMLLILLGFYFTLKHSQNITQLAPPDALAPAAHIADQGFEDWKEFVSPQGYFRVLVPTLPHHATDKLQDLRADGVKTYDTYLSEKSDGTAFMISRVEVGKQISPAEREKVLTQVVNDLLEHNKDNKLQLMQLGKFYSYDAVDFALQNGLVNVVGKAFVVKGNIYILTMVTNSGNANENQFTFFANSFKIEKE